MFTRNEANPSVELAMLVMGGIINYMNRNINLLPSRNNSPTEPDNKKAFTLLELIIVIIIVGILAVLGLSQYTNIVEKGRIAEARANIGTMRKLAYEYYLKNGSFTDIQASNVGIGVSYPSSCNTSYYFSYGISNFGTYVALQSFRCSSGGKSPDSTRRYYYRNYYTPPSGDDWHCYYYDDSSACFGLPS